MDKKNVQKRNSTKHFWEKTRGLYNKWAEGLKRTRDHCIFINAYKTAVIKSKKKNNHPPYLRRDPMAPTTAAAGASAGTNVAATGRTRSTTGKIFLTAGTTFFLRKFFCSGSAALKSILFVKGVKGQRGGYTICRYYNMGDMRQGTSRAEPLCPP